MFKVKNYVNYNFQAKFIRKINAVRVALNDMTEYHKELCQYFDSVCLGIAIMHILSMLFLWFLFSYTISLCSCEVTLVFLLVIINDE